jgi:hypothetical protein
VPHDRQAAARKGRSEIAFFWIALLVSPVLAGVIVASLAPAAGEMGAARQSTKSMSVDIVEEIKRLGELREAGLLTDDEFTAKKTELLNRM